MRWILDPLSRWSTWLVALSMAWVVLGLALAYLEPWLIFSSFPRVGFLVPFSLSAILIIANAGLMIRLLARFGQLIDALPAFLTTLLLSGVLSFQIASYLGIQHYLWKRVPDWHDWLLLPLMYGLRGFDILDLSDTYRWPVFNLEPASLQTSCLAFCMQLLTGIFFFFILAKWYRLGRDACCHFFDSYPGSLWSFITLPFIYGSFAVVTLVIGASISARTDVGNWTLSRWLELPGWLVDQTLRVIDLGDAMNLLDWRLHSWPGFWWLLLAGVLLRMVLMVILFEALYRYGPFLSLKHLNGIFLRPAVLDQLYHHAADPVIRRLAGQRLFTVCLAEPNQLWVAWVVLSLGLLLGLAGGSAWRQLGKGQHDWAAAARGLANHAIADRDSDAQRALLGLRRLGPYGAPAKDILAVGLLSASPQRRQAIVLTLGYFGPAAMEILEELLHNKDPELAPSVIEAMCQIGPPAVATMVRLSERAPPALAEALLSALRQQGASNLPILTMLLDKTRAPQLVPLLEQIDPQWYLHDPGMSPAREVRTARIALHLLLGPAKFDRNDRLWARDDTTQIPGPSADPVHLAPFLRDLGPISAAAAPVLVRKLGADQTSSYGTSQLLVGLEHLGPQARPVVPDLVRLMDRQPKQAEAIRRALNRIDPNWQSRSRS